MAELVYNYGRLVLGDGQVSLTTEGAVAASSFHVMLVSTDYLDVTDATIIDQDFVLSAANTSQCAAHFEAATSGNYSRQTLGATTANEDDTGNLAYFDAADVTFSSVSSGAGVIGAAVIFCDLTGNDSEAPLIAKYDTNFPVTPNGGDITLQISTGGWLQYST
jgi:hypothetical protein